MRAIGLMSGTSLDGMDAALLESDGERITSVGPALSMPFDTEAKTVLQKAVDDALVWRFVGDQPTSFAAAAQVLSTLAEHAVRALIQKAGIDLNTIEVVGFHGQTVLHHPPKNGQNGKTCQIGDAQGLANALGVPVVHDFRSRDMENGGQGAPLAPAYHRALAIDSPKPLVVLNIGGVGNLTWLDANGAMLAFDTGPGNGPLDALIKAAGRGDMDKGGTIAATGMVDDACLKTLMGSDFFERPPPKSVDRWDFDTDAVQAMSLPDGAATLTAFCAQSVARSMDWLPSRPKAILVCGGGRHNPTLMVELASRTGVKVKSVEAHGWRGDALEAEAFAYLAIRHVKGLPTSWPESTGVAAPVCGGVIAAPYGSPYILP